MSDRAKVMAIAEEIKNGGVQTYPDYIILNAGIVRGQKYLEDKSEADVKKCFEVNVYQLFWFAQAFIPLLS